MKRILFIADPPPGGNGTDAPVKETPEQIIKRLQAENKALTERVNADEQADAQRAADELAITHKTKLGLSRDQAIAVIKRQREHDQALEEKRAARLPAIKAIIASSKDELSARRAARIQYPDMDGGEWAAALKAASGRK